MFALIHVVLMVGLVRLSVDWDRPISLAGMYAGTWILLRLPFVLGSPGVVASMAILLAGALAALIGAVLFFKLLSQSHEQLRWWLVVLAGNILVYILAQAAQELAYSAMA